MCTVLGYSTAMINKININNLLYNFIHSTAQNPVNGMAVALLVMKHSAGQSSLSTYYIMICSEKNIATHLIVIR